VNELMIGKEKAKFGDCRKALHEAAIACTPRVNLFWPTVVSTTVLDRPVSASSPKSPLRSHDSDVAA